MSGSINWINPPPPQVPVLIIFFIAVIVCLLGVAGGILSVRQILRNVGDLFANPSWQLFGLVLAGVVFIPLLFQSLRRGIRAKARTDFVAIAGFLVFLLLLYLPFGFESIGHWEEWVVNAYFEGRASKLSVELVSRFWEIVPHALAYLIKLGHVCRLSRVEFIDVLGQAGATIRHLAPPPLFPSVYIFDHYAIHGISGQFGTHVASFLPDAVQYAVALGRCLPRTRLCEESQPLAYARYLAVVDIQYH